MLRSEFITKTYLKATGKPTAPSAGSRKYNQIVELGKFYTDTWQQEPETDWTSLFDFRTVGTVTATDRFTLSDDINKISQQSGDNVKIVHTDNTTSYWGIVPADRLQEYKEEKVVSEVGGTILFPKAFASTDEAFGGSIVVPSYGFAEFPDDDTGDIEIDDPNWLVVICAAEFVRNDITRQNQYPNLVAEANVLMEKMKENSGVKVDEIYRPNFLLCTDVEW